MTFLMTRVCVMISELGLLLRSALYISRRALFDPSGLRWTYQNYCLQDKVVEANCSIPVLVVVDILSFKSLDLPLFCLVVTCISGGYLEFYGLSVLGLEVMI